MAVLIVGMHRSGTSAISGVLNKLGVAVPADLHPADEHNQRGYFEPRRIIDFHEALLARLGSPSNDPLPLDYEWVRSPVGRAAAVELADILDEEFGGEPMCLFKDPRICRLMPVWTEALKLGGRSAVAVLPCRHPLEVAGSLAAKAGLDRAYALYMWLQHVILGERFTRDMPRSFTRYEGLLGDWRATVRKLTDELGVAWPRDLMRAGPDIDAFLARELRHHQASTEALDPHAPLDVLCARVWDATTQLQSAPYDAAAMATLDAVWAELESALDVVAPLVVSYQREERRLIEENRDRASQIEERDRHLNEVDRKLAERDRQILHRDELVLARDRLIVDRDARLQQADAALARADQEARTAGEAARDAQAALRETHDAFVLSEAMRKSTETALQAAQMEVMRLQPIEQSSFWALSHPLRRLLTRFPALRSIGRKALKLVWWTATFQLAAKLRQRKQILQGTAAMPPPPPAPVHVPAPPVLRSTPAPAAPEHQPAALRPTPTLRAPPIPAATEDEAPPYAPTLAPSGKPLHVVFVSGEANTPGHKYRITRWAEAARQGGATASVHPIQMVDPHLDEVARADLLYLWRAPWTPEVERLVDAARAGGTPILFDCDDLMFEPHLATVEVIDGIRSQGYDAVAVQAMYARVNQTLQAADYCSAPTQPLARRMRRYWKPTFVLPNGFDEEVLLRSRLAARRKRANPESVVRIGYAAGSKTHQKDFGLCAGAVARVLREHPECRLVLFASGEWPVMDIAEFPMFEGLEAQIEWRQLVPIADLPDELARFDVNLAPVEVGNLFCESKSELKFFEAALAGVTTIASPTEPFRTCIRDGETGFLASSEDEWYAALKRLVSDSWLRWKMSSDAYYDSAADYGPERRTELFLSVLDQVVSGGRRAARAFELDIKRAAEPRRQRPHVPPHEVIFAHDALGSAEITVIIPLYNYAHFIEEALDSVRAQTIAALDLVIVNDASTDQSEAVARAWLEANAHRFNRAILIRNTPNAGLGFSRNVGFANAETPFVLPLDADNRLRPEMCEQALETIRSSGAAYVYPRIRQFGNRIELMGEWRYDPARLVGGNFVDAMTLIRKAAWADVGGYDHVRYGWEDYDLWCRFAERGHYGQRLLNVLAEYRVHGQSMLHSETEQVRNKERLMRDMERRHAWLRIDRADDWDAQVAAATKADPEPAPAASGSGASEQDPDRLKRLLPILRCPTTGAPLEKKGKTLRAKGTDKVWPMALGRPVLFEDLGEPRSYPDSHISNPIPDEIAAMIEAAAPGLVLNLSAGGTQRRFPNVVEAEFAVFRHTDVIADAHALPFQDEVFELVVSMNAFEHYHTPTQAVSEIMRVLKPGGRVLVRTAFMQPQHEAPWHFYNCTRYGLERWFAPFETLDLQVSENFNPIYALTWQMSEAEALMRRDVSPQDAERLMAATGRQMVDLWRNPASRDSALWTSFFDLPQPSQEVLAAGFQFLGRKPG